MNALPQPADHPALALEDLEVAYTVGGVPRAVLRGVSFSIAPGESYGLVGESGCGKSTTAYAALRYLPRNGRITGGRALIDGTDVTRLSGRELQRLRAVGGDAGLVAGALQVARHHFGDGRLVVDDQHRAADVLGGAVAAHPAILPGPARRGNP